MTVLKTETETETAVLSHNTDRNRRSSGDPQPLQHYGKGRKMIQQFSQPRQKAVNRKMPDDSQLHIPVWMRHQIPTVHVSSVGSGHLSDPAIQQTYVQYINTITANNIVMSKLY